MLQFNLSLFNSKEEEIKQINNMYLIIKDFKMIFYLKYMFIAKQVQTVNRRKELTSKERQYRQKYKQTNSKIDNHTNNFAGRKTSRQEI